MYIIYNNVKHTSTHQTNDAVLLLFSKQQSISHS